ncbi:MAG TPA: glutamate-1-semialdehyde 2,1-aminomutase [Candidatus Dormibacteraeota bacterium]|nr:glutamate-1-semialdehyde 2,1-aminomutase [Candidatus Dormibacteraeota bacterium]
MARLASKSRKLYKRAVRTIPGGVNSPVRYYPPYPMFVQSARGPRFRTIDGTELVDYCMAYGALIDGHSRPEVVSAVRRAVGQGSIYGQPTENEVELAELIYSLVPSIQMVRLVNTGTEATMHAVRLARGFTGKKKILTFEGGFHGSHDSVLARRGVAGSPVARPGSAGVPVETSRNTLIASYNDDRMAENIIRDHADELGAVIVEPVAGNMGPVLPAKGFLESLRRLTRQNGVVLIFDEVITGFRLGLGGAQEQYGIRPDLTILGKIVGGGLPLAAFGGRREIMRRLAPMGDVYQAGTYSGNPVSVAAGLASLRSLKKRSGLIYSDLAKNGEFLAEGIRDELDSQNISAQVNQIGSMFQVFFTKRGVTNYVSAKSSDTHKYNRYFRSLLASGVFVPPSQFETCFLSTAHTREDVEHTVEVIGDSLRTV